MSVGIVGYGFYVPQYRIRVEEIAKVWGDTPQDIKGGLGIQEKSVPGLDEDAATIAVEVGRMAVRNAEIDPQKIGAIYVGSESHPYAVKPTSSIVAAAIRADPELTAADYEFACKAGTAAIQTCMGLVKSKMIDYGLAIGADTSQGRPGDALEYSAAAGGAGFILGRDNIIAKIKDTYSYTTDTPDFWRREGQEFPKHGGRFTGKPGYFRHVINASQEIMERNSLEVKDFDSIVFHQPNAKFPRKVSKYLGIKRKKIKNGLLCPRIGNTYSGSTPLGLCNVLDNSQEGDLILAVSYGSGAGSDAFIIEMEKEPQNKIKVEDILEKREQLDYARYAKFMNKIKTVGLRK